MDVLGDAASLGQLDVYLVLTAGATVAAGASVDVRVNKRRVTGQAFVTPTFAHNAATPAAGATVRYYLGRYSASRYMAADVRNNDATNAVTAAVLYELEKLS